MKISALVVNLSNNAIVRSYPIAKVLQRRWDVEVVGFRFSPHVYPAYAAEFPIKSWFARSIVDCFRQLPDVIESIEGDVIYAFKPRPTTLGLALLVALKRERSCPIVLDIEDEEVLGYSELYPNALKFAYHCLLRGWTYPNAFQYTWFVDKLARYAQEVTVVSHTLRQRYGRGQILRHGADVSFFDPTRFDKKSLREKWDVPMDRFTLLFAGMPRPHKGLGDLVDALVRLRDLGPLLLIVGGQPQDSAVVELIRRAPGLIQHVPLQPHAVMPEFLALADLVVLPQKGGIVAQSQIPGKLFEAMAMAKPIIATAVSDLPEILAGCGIVVDPDDVPALTGAIEHVIMHPDQAQAIGKRARQRCVDRYSWDAMERVLIPVFSQFEHLSSDRKRSSPQDDT